MASTSFSVQTSSPSTAEEASNPSMALLSSSDQSPSLPRRSSPFLFSTLLITTCISTAAAMAFAFLLFSSPTSIANPSKLQARPLIKLSHPVVLLVSFDGFRYGYQFKAQTLNIHRLISNGTEAEPGLIPVFPSLTFPNHYSIVTGLYPAYHGIINNHFTDPTSGEVFSMSSHEPTWWLGEPLWETVVNHGLNAATFFWPGSEVKKGSWSCPSEFCHHYNGSVPFEQRVDSILNYFDLPNNQIPSLMTLYFEDPDHQGHQFGPDDPAITEAILHVDAMIGRLIAGLEKRGVFQDVTLILLGDHGMVGNCDKKAIFLDDLAPWVDVHSDWIQSLSPLLAITPPSEFSAAQVVKKMNEGLSSGRVNNGEHMKMYLKEDLPKRLHYSESYRIPAIIGIVDEGYKVEMKRKESGKGCGGAHGYDNAYFSMRTIFVGHGPQFAKGMKVPAFENVEIYNLIASILNLEGAPNNGSLTFPDSVLLPYSS
ncbi:putative nucleotide diphosphatase [Dioscorea sansibarensis]